MFDRRDVSLGIRRMPAGSVLVDRSCGSCPACSAGASLWCTRPDAEGRDLASPVADERIDALATAVLGAAALVEAPASSTVLVVERPEGPLAVLVRSLATWRVLVVPDPLAPEVKATLADLEPTGRAAVVVAGADARAAVKAVRRGGHVCVGDPAALLPSVTELVQREVTLLGARGAADVVRRLDAPTWAAAAAAA